MCSVNAQAASMVIINGDGPGEGFNDPAPFTSAGGNNATTLGQARLNAFQYAADIWGALLDSSVPVEIYATLDPLGGTTSSATLGQAGPATVIDSFPGAPQTAVLYPIALANALTGVDQIPQANAAGAPAEDITGQFNSDVDGNIVLGTIHWYYGFDGQPPTNPLTGQQDEDFVSTVLHELGHGLGFVDGMNIDTINHLVSKVGGMDSTFDLNVEHHGGIPSSFSAMTDAQRYVAVTSVNALHFIGANTVAARGGHAELYAPSQANPGSTLAHFDETALPNELMSPFSSGPQHQVGLALQVMRDIGWRLTTPAPPQISGPTLIPAGTAMNYALSTVATATSYEWESTRRITTIATEGAETGLTPWLSSVSAGYSVIDNQNFATGANALHLAMPVATDQLLTLNREFRPGGASQMQFQSSMNCAGSGQTARVQLSQDDGSSWVDVWSQQGNQTGCSLVAAPFAMQRVSLAAYAGKRIRLRFFYAYISPGTFFNNIDPTTGWHIDDISMTNAEEYTASVISTLASNAFVFSAAATGGYSLRGRAQVNTGTTSWGPDFDITVSGVVASSFTYNYSFSKNAATTSVTAIGFILTGTGITTADQLAAAVPNSDLVSRWDPATQAYISHTPGSPFNNFSLVAGEAYFISVAANSTLALTGTLPVITYAFVKNAATTSVTAIGLRQGSVAGGTTTADQLATAIVGSDLVSRWDPATQAYISHTPASPFNNFIVQDGQAYFISVTQNATW